MKNKLEILKHRSKLKKEYINRFKLKKSFEEYSQFINSESVDNSITEMALSPLDISNMEKLRLAKRHSDIIIQYKESIDLLKDICIKLDYDDIKWKFVGYYEVYFTKQISKILSKILNDLSNEDEEVIDKINRDGYDDPHIDIEIDEKVLNKIDIINGLPNFLQGLGLGKKMYKKFIKELGYISSWSGGDVNLDSSMIWKSLASDNDLFMFCNDNNIICFWIDLEYDKIMIKLREFYYKKGNIIIDSDFLKKYSMNKEYLINLL
jgi:hypothetical protein